MGTPVRNYALSGALKPLGWLIRFCDRHRVFVAVGICTAIAVAAAALATIFWGWLSGGESGSTTIRNIALVLAGLIALPLALWRGVVAERQASTAQQSLRNERYQKGAEMLGSEVLSVRLGGIYALQRLAEDYPDQYHVQIMRLFCAFLRHTTKDAGLISEQVRIEPGTHLGIRQDVEAISSRAESRIVLERKVGFRLDLRGADLPGIQFSNADLSSAFFHHSNLSGANLSNTDLSDALLNSADLSGVIFENVKFTGTSLWFANLSGSLLQDADLPSVSFHGANLSCANLLRANLSGAIFQDAVLSNAWLESANLSRASFLRANLSGAWLVKSELSQASFLDTDLNKADISEANLTGVEFTIGGTQTVRGLTQA